MANSEIRNSRPTSSSKTTSATKSMGTAAKGSANPKKHRRKMKKQVRKTIAGLFLASAIVVASLPVQETQASSTDETEMVVVLNYDSDSAKSSAKYLDSYDKYSTTEANALPSEWQSKVPYVDHDATIYTTQGEDGYTFQFAYVKPYAEANDEVAIILGAQINSLPGNKLTVPSKVDAYLKYSGNTTSSGYCAVNRKGKFLYYKDSVQKLDENEYKLFNVPSKKLTEITEYYNTLDDKNDDDSVNDRRTNTVTKTFLRQRSGDTLVYDYVTEVTVTVSVLSTNEIISKNTTESTEDAVPVMVDSYLQCYYADRDNWINRSDSDLYYWEKEGATEDDPTDQTGFKQATSQESQRIYNADVQYIGRQHLEGVDGTWKIAGEVTPNNLDKGVFAGKTQIVYLTIGDNLLGIGDGAFYNCGGIQEVSLGNGLKTIGNEAFANCINMYKFDMQTFSEIQIIGKNAFNNCRALKSIAIPVGVQAIGDYCFNACEALESIDLCGAGNNVQLNVIGYNAFNGCKKLTSVTFPESFKQNSNGLDADEKEGIPIKYFDGCESLQFIEIKNDTLDIIDGKDVTAYKASKKDSSGKLVPHLDSDDEINTFLSGVSDSFEFVGPQSSNAAIHETAKIHEASYKFYDNDNNEYRYERVVICPEDAKHVNTFIVNDSNELVVMEIDPECQIVEIPETIGTHGISAIGEFSFQYKCNLKKVVIPSTVTTIEKDAFKGCHNLEDVVFTEPINITSIGPNAFATQDIIGSKLTCSRCSGESAKLKETPFLSFTGTIDYDSQPFAYAMNPDNYINNEFQTDYTYITFYSQWPTNLTVQYDKDTDKNTLINYPKYDDFPHYAVKKYDESQNPGDVAYPALTKDYADQAHSAATTADKDRTGVQRAIINSALNINLPAGIEAIKEGIFSAYKTDGTTINAGTSSGGVNSESNTKIQSLTTNTVEKIDPYAFAGCTSLTGFYQNPEGCISIGDYAFRNDTSLANVDIAASVSEMGLRPFMGCDTLSGVGFNDSTNYASANGIIYGLTNGAKTNIVECLEGRGSSFGNALVGPEELADVTSMSPEAFMDCDGIGQVDLSSSKLNKVPERAFALTGNLGSVKLPEDTCKGIGKGAFWGSNVYYVEVPKSITLIQPDAFADVETTDQDPLNETVSGTTTNTKQYIVYDPVKDEPKYVNQTTGHKTITAYCVEDSAMDTYAEDYYYINPEHYVPTIYHTVYFWDTYYSTSDPDLIETQQVKDGEDAVPPAFPAHQGETANAWTPNYRQIVRDTDVTTVYGSDIYEIKFICGYCGEVLDVQYIEYQKNATPPADSSLHDHTADNVYFKNWVGNYLGVTADGTVAARYSSPPDTNTHVVKFYANGQLVSTQNVPDGNAATAPMPPTKSGYTFVSWQPSDFKTVIEDMVIVAEYEKNAPPGPVPGPTSSASPSGSASPSASPTATSKNGNNGNDGETTKYTVTVSGGSGSGSYPAGAIVGINAYDMGTGQAFDKWTTSTAGVGFADANATSTFFTMPAANVAITATYKTGGGSGGSGGSGSGGNGSGGGSGSRTPANNGNTTVNMDGVSGYQSPSSKGVAGASVSGSTDNFMVKVTDDTSAAQMAQTALQNAFGANFANVKYLPFDVSLYDSTGTTKIADTSGMSVNITMPLPDELAPYAGNNKVASVAGGSLENLNSRFTTVDGVPCISFTATHFSPYVIYVDTKNLTESTIDYTPKTGDPIHPKWFLAIGLAAISLILFFKRDKKVVRPV